MFYDSVSKQKLMSKIRTGGDVITKMTSFCKNMAAKFEPPETLSQLWRHQIKTNFLKYLGGIFALFLIKRVGQIPYLKWGQF